MQRYKFESNSQLHQVYLQWGAGCLCQCKDTNLKAIHNWKNLSVDFLVVVYANAKIQIWKQFTTQNVRVRLEAAVVYANAKIQIWKQFTTQISVSPIPTCCLCQCKDTNLKAIHNMKPYLKNTSRVVYANAKIQIWKQFTTCGDYRPIDSTLFMPMQRYKFESNSQPEPAVIAIWQVVYANAKIQIWKQFTTTVIVSLFVILLFMPMQRYKFESNSQRVTSLRDIMACCLCQCKDTNLKAIHNSGMSLANSLQVVYANAKIQIWKQFTTQWTRTRS